MFVIFCLNGLACSLHLVYQSAMVDLLVAQLNSRTLHRCHGGYLADFLGYGPPGPFDFGFGDEYLFDLAHDKFTLQSLPFLLTPPSHPISSPHPNRVLDYVAMAMKEAPLIWPDS